MRVLHITNWYPNPVNSKDALFIQRHIESLGQFVDYEITHLEVKPARKFSYLNKSISDGQQLIFTLPFESWIVIEIISAIVLTFLLLRAKVNRKFDIINFHIAYPNLTYWHLIKKFIRTPIVITEHWSAYHFNFGVIKPLNRIKRIFQQGIPVISISYALQRDIKLFSKSEFPNFVISNVVDKEIFYSDSNIKRNPFFFMVSNWSYPKNPFIAMDAFLKIANKQKEYKLIIAGYGDQWNEIKTWIRTHQAADKITLIGKLENKEIAHYMQSCMAFLLPSAYETFSVVCAEALCCGATVIASNVGGIPEVIGNSGILIHKETVDNWSSALNDAINDEVDKKDKNCEFSKELIGKEYFQVLKKIIKEVLILNV